MLCLVIHYARAEKRIPRPTITLWLWYLLAVYLMASFGSGIIYFGENDFGFCVVNVVMLLYAIMAPFLHYALKRDSDYLSSEENDYRDSE